RGGVSAADLAAGLGAFGLGALVLVRLGVRLDHAVWGLLAAGVLPFVPSLARAVRPPTLRPWSVGRSVALLHAPLVILAALIPQVAWDDYSHWLPNALFLVEWRSFPGPDLPPPRSQHGTYPPGTALVTFGATLIGRTLFGLEGIAETAAPVLAVTLYGCLAATVADAVRSVVASHWAGAAIALLGVVWINPAFVPRIVFTNYGDAPTAALLGLAVVVALRGLEDRDGRAIAPAGLILAAITNVKQTGLVVAALACGGVLVVLLADRSPGRLGRVLRTLPALLPPAVVWLLWREHASAASGGFSIRPLASWSWNLAPQTLASMGRVALSKIAFTALLVAAAAMGVRALRRGEASPLGRASVVLSVVAVGWAVVLFLAYMGTSFHEGEIIRAASFWRYMTQLGGLGGVVLTLSFVGLCRAIDLPGRWRRLSPSGLGRAATAAPAVLVAVLPVLAIGHLWPRASEPAPPLRRAAAELAPRVAGTGPVMVVDPRGNGMTHVVLDFAWRGTVPTVWGGTAHRVETIGAEALVGRAAATGARFVMILSTDAEVERAFGTPPLGPRSWRLLEAGSGDWRRIAEGTW
ncbi:MAG: hypothetical protein SNJ73_05860, partial [Acetobacteraceae bacterium]